MNSRPLSSSPLRRTSARGTSTQITMSTSARLLLLCLPLGCVSLLTAQTAPTTPPAGGPGPGRGHGPRGNPVVRLLDADRDRVLSAAELAGAPAALRALDTNNDGSVSRDELHPPRGTGPRAGEERPAPPTPPASGDDARPFDPVMRALDANGDFILSAAEIANAVVSLNALDLNKDGKLTEDEFRPLPPTDAPARPRGRAPKG